MNAPRIPRMAVAAGLALALAAATPAWAGGYYHGGYYRPYGHGVGPIGLLVGAAAAVIAAPFVLASRVVAPAPVYAPPPVVYAAPSYAPPPGYVYAPAPVYYGRGY